MVKLIVSGYSSYQVMLGDRLIGEVERFIGDRKGMWSFRNADGAYGEVRTQRKAITALVELATRTWQDNA